MGRLRLFLTILALTQALGGLPAFARGSVLRVRDWASCLKLEMGGLSLAQESRAIQARYRFNSQDLLLPYLALYSGVRFPGGLPRDWQTQAQIWWADAWSVSEARLAYDLVALAQSSGPNSISINQLLSLTYKSCKTGDLFCSSLLLHNVLRTIGRYTTARELNPVNGNYYDHNPEWFKENKVFWQQNRALIDRALFPISQNLSGERFGGWYHLFGILAYGTRLLALSEGDRDALTPLKTILTINRYGNPLFTWGGTLQDNEGAERDQDVVHVLDALVQGVAIGDRQTCSQWSKLIY